MRLGYACISIPLRERGIYTGRTLTIRSMKQKGAEEAKRLTLLNITDLAEILRYNESIGIRFFRITSNLFPHMENPAAPPYDMEFAADALAAVGGLARALGHRITMHPGQFAQLGSPRPEVVEQTRRDLAAHARIFELMGQKPEVGSVMIIHGGGVYGDKEATLQRWKTEFKRLPAHVSRFIALENDEWQYSVYDLLPLCEELGIPLCVDFFHHSVQRPVDELFVGDTLARVLQTWKRRGIKPKVHLSSQAPDARRGSHSDCVDGIPSAILHWCAANDVDIMLEVKQKDLCALEMYKKYYTRTEADGRVQWQLKTRHNYT